MGFHVVSKIQETIHLTEHKELNLRCPLCARFGASPAGEGCAGRIIAINPPATFDQSQWGETK